MLLSFAARRRPEKAVAPAAPGLGRWLLRTMALLFVVAAFLGGIIALGHWGLEHLRGRDRYLVPLAEVECEPPPGLERGEFLEQVQYYGHLPELVQLLDQELHEQLRSAFALHPWVEKVEDVTIEPPRRIAVRLRYRAPVLAVFLEGELRAVDGKGVLLPRKAPTRGLPVYPGWPRPPQGEGKRWGDADLEAEARKLQR